MGEARKKEINPGMTLYGAAIQIVTETCKENVTLFFAFSRGRL